ncbi:MAG: poly-gamma-glutamate system protein [Spirochaetota bacterium]
MRKSVAPRLQGGAASRTGNAGELAGLGAFVLVILIAFLVLPGLSVAGPTARAELQAAAGMRTAMAAIAEELGARGLSIDPSSDPLCSGLIGLRWSGLTSTLGSLEAKRSAAQPAAAALLVRLLVRAGARPGDTVAIDSSASFPGFAIASLVAASELGITTIFIASAGSSTWGANRPEFSLADMVSALSRRGIIDGRVDAVSPGGALDRGLDLEPAALARVLDRAVAGGARLLSSVNLDEAISLRRAFIARQGGDSHLAAIVSIGGNLASTGPGDVLAGRSGILWPRDFPAGKAPGRGLVQTFLAEGIPVIRLIDVKDLSATSGLPWDPDSWPADPGLPPRLPAAWVLMFAILALGAGLLTRRFANIILYKYIVTSGSMENP